MERDDGLWHGESYEIHTTDEFVRLVRIDTQEMLWHLRWDEIDLIAAWKNDLFVVDRICMGFGWPGSDALKRVDEQMLGWDALQQALEHRFGIRGCDWWRDVAMPPFAENYRVLWKCSNSSEHCDS